MAHRSFQPYYFSWGILVIFGEFPQTKMELFLQTSPQSPRQYAGATPKPRWLGRNSGRNKRECD